MKWSSYTKYWHYSGFVSPLIATRLELFVWRKQSGITYSFTLQNTTVCVHGAASVRNWGPVQRTIFWNSVLTEPSGQPVQFSKQIQQRFPQSKQAMCWRARKLRYDSRKEKRDLCLVQKCRDEIKETFGAPFNVYRSWRGESQRQKRLRREAEHWPVSNSVRFIFGTHWIRDLVGFALSLDIEQTACNWPGISNGL